jgi:hypothetical protein
VAQRFSAAIAGLKACATRPGFNAVAERVQDDQAHRIKKRGAWMIHNQIASIQSDHCI